MDAKIGAVIFEGGIDSSSLDHELRAIRKVLTLELLTKCRKNELISKIILVTDHEDLINQAAGLYTDVYQTEHVEFFHYGRTLLTVCERYDIDKVLTFSGASAPLMTSGEFDQLVCLLNESDNTVIANNPQSADIIAIAPASTLQKILLPAIDNPLPWILKEEGKLNLLLLPVSAGYNFDLDTPLDLVYLGMHPACPPGLHKKLGKWQAVASRVMAASRALAVPNGEILMTGRVSPWIMSHINEHVRCRLRVISEERGMKALGRQEKNEVYSIFGKLVDTMGLDTFFSYLQSWCAAAFIDTRVLFGHWQLQPDNDDRFYSDLGEYDKINDPTIRKLTKLAVDSQIPVILGGHSIVAGGMMVLIDKIRLDSAQDATKR